MRFTSSITLLAALSMCLPGLFAQGSQPVLQTLYTFTGGSDAAYPSGGLARDSHGVLYGLSSQGGSYGLGSAYKVTPPAAGGSTWTEAVIHSFGGSNDVQTPLANPVLDSSGNLYGATTSPYFGGVFELSPPTSGSAWAEPLILYPCEYRVALSGPVLLDGQGNLYSECQDGQVQSYSLLYERTTVLYDPEQAETAVGGVALDSSGNVFGASEYGGPRGYGTVFEISNPAGKWSESYIFRFPGLTRLYIPMNGVTVGPDGAVYGTATYSDIPSTGGGVFRLSPPTSGSIWNEVTLNVFTGPNGLFPSGPVAFDSKGNLYGTTAGGGVATTANPDGCGTVYKLLAPATPGGAWAPGWVYQFTCGADGVHPAGNLVVRSDGTIYGTTTGISFDGTNLNYGTVFQITQPRAE